MAETKVLGKKERVERLQYMMEKITGILASMYQGENEKVSLNQTKGYGYNSQVNISYISLERPETKRRLRDGFLLRTRVKEDLIFAVAENFSDKPNGENNLGVLVESEFSDIRDVEVVIESALGQYVNDCAPINVHEEKFRYVIQDKQDYMKNNNGQKKSQD